MRRHCWLAQSLGWHWNGELTTCCHSRLEGCINYLIVSKFKHIQSIGPSSAPRPTWKMCCEFHWTAFDCVRVCVCVCLYELFAAPALAAQCGINYVISILTFRVWAFRSRHCSQPNTRVRGSRRVARQKVHIMYACTYFLRHHIFSARALWMLWLLLFVG